MKDERQNDFIIQLHSMQMQWRPFLFNSNASHFQSTNIVHLSLKVLDLDFVIHLSKCQI